MDGSVSKTARAIAAYVEQYAAYLDTADRRRKSDIPRTWWPSLRDPAFLWPYFARLRAACDETGEPADDVLRIAVDLIESVSPAVAAYRQAGDLKRWNRNRDRVRELLDELRAASLQDEPPDEDRDVVVRSAVVPAASSRPTPARTAAIGSDAQARAREKGDKAKRSPRRRRPGTGNPPGRPSKDTDDLLRKVIRQIADESRREKIDVERELHDRVYERTADELCELILERLRKKVAPSTLRSSSKLWRTWSIFRDRRGKPTGTTAEDVPVEYGSLRVGGVKKTIEERRQDAELARYGITLDDD
jgi:hypothetical protein